jgi:hypothetical protein
MPIIRYILTYPVDGVNKKLIPLLEGERKKKKETYVFSLRQRQRQFFPYKLCIVTSNKTLKTSYLALARSLCALKPQTAPLKYFLSKLLNYDIKASNKVYI